MQLRIKNAPNLTISSDGKSGVGGVEQGIGISVSRQLRLVKAYKEMTEAKGAARSIVERIICICKGIYAYIYIYIYIYI